jgi:[acyl-carrier-protein] S-malonyltransferase
LEEGTPGACPEEEKELVRVGGIALLLPGQGSQYVGMGRGLASEDTRARDVYREADELLGLPLSRICWEGPEEELRRTENAQPAILLHSYAAWRLLPEETRSAAVVAAGHSLGEFTAYLLSGTLEFSDALRLVRRRGELMAASGRERPGTMAAVLGLEPDVLGRVCAEVGDGTVVPANFNAPGQIVISGDVPAVGRAAALALQAGARKAVPLNVSGAFHSPLMDSARSGLASALETVELRDPAFPVIANASARPVTDGGLARVLLVRQLTSPVRWVECVEAMRECDPDCWLEIGPGRILSGLLRRIDRSQTVYSADDSEGIQRFVEAFSDARA